MPSRHGTGSMAARGLWATGELGDPEAAREAVLRFIRSRLHRVGLPAPETLGSPDIVS
ncbi:MAG TPA: hypothetical protein VF041_20295 [Gemmatimonadaceae bacterium]